MDVGDTPPVDEARSIFDDLGYSIRGDGREFTAERKWRAVRVTATAGPEGATTGGEGGLRCYVTWADRSTALRDRLRRSDPDCEWAVIGVEDGDGRYEVLREPTAR